MVYINKPCSTKQWANHHFASYIACYRACLMRKESKKAKENVDYMEGFTLLLYGTIGLDPKLIKRTLKDPLRSL